MSESRLLTAQALAQEALARHARMKANQLAPYPWQRWAGENIEALARAVVELTEKTDHET